MLRAGGCADRGRIPLGHRRFRRRRPSRRGSGPTAPRPPTRRPHTARPAPGRWWCPTKRGPPGIGSSCGCRARALPAVEVLLVVLGHVVEDDEHLRARILDDGGQRALPADVLAAERQPPAVQPSGPAIGEWGARSQHLLRMHVRSVGGVDRHGESLRLRSAGCGRSTVALG